MVADARRGFNSRLWFGLLFLLLGALWTLDNLNIVDSEPILDWWPLILVALGLSKFGLGSTRRPLAGAIWVAVGVVLLAHNFGVVHFSIWELWPVALIALGASMVWRTMRGPVRRDSLAGAAGMPSDGGDPGAAVGDVVAVESDEDTFSATAVWAGIERRSTSRRFVGGDATAVMGGIEIDLRGAKPVPGGAVIEVFAMMGGIEIIVPREWRVVNDAFAIMGGVEDSRPATPDLSQDLLIVKGTAIMGGIEIRSAKDKS